MCQQGVNIGRIIVIVAHFIKTGKYFLKYLFILILKEQGKENIWYLYLRHIWIHRSPYVTAILRATWLCFDILALCIWIKTRTILAAIGFKFCERGSEGRKQLQWNIWQYLTDWVTQSNLMLQKLKHTNLQFISCLLLGSHHCPGDYILYQDIFRTAVYVPACSKSALDMLTTISLRS